MRTFVSGDEDMMRAQAPIAVVTGAAGFIGSHLSAPLVARTGEWLASMKGSRAMRYSGRRSGRVM
jgi:nucleoside-diphosphate-sugar epimerase